MTEIEQVLISFNENVLTVFAVTLSVLALALYEMTGHPIWDWIKRPKIKTMPQKIERCEHEDKKDNPDRFMEFWINIKNTGKSPAIRCKPRLRLVVGLEDKFTMGNTQDQLANEDFAVPWQIQGKKSEYEDILPSDRFERRIRVPITVGFFREGKSNAKTSKPSFNFYFDDPIETFVWTQVQDKNNNFRFGVEMTVTSISGSFHQKYFIITVPIHSDS